MKMKGSLKKDLVCSWVHVVVLLLLHCYAIVVGGVDDDDDDDVGKPLKQQHLLESMAIMTNQDGHGGAITDPATLFSTVEDVWKSIVRTTSEAGLVDAKYGDVPSAPLTEEEAWHHYTAGLNGVVDSARLMLAFSAVPSLHDAGGPLHIAAAEGDLDAVESILDEANEAGTALTLVANEGKDDGTTPLITAATLGHADVVRLLLEEGANPEATGRNGATALHLAATMGDTDTIRALVEGGADVNYPHEFARTTALHFASEMGASEAVRLLCELGADAEAQKRHGGRPLHTASDCNQTDSVLALLGPPCNADPESKLLGDTTALYLAAQRGFVNVARVLMVKGGLKTDFAMPYGDVGKNLWARDDKAGQFGTGAAPNKFYADPNQEIGNGATALHAATENGHPDMVQLLLDHGANPNDSSMEGATPLILAAQYNRPKIARMLLRRGAEADFRMRSRGGATALYFAAGYGHVKVVRELLRGGGSVDIPVGEVGATPLAYAASAGHADIVGLLLTAGADPEAGDSRQSPLCVAADAGNFEVLKALLEANAIVDAVAGDSQTPLLLACNSKKATRRARHQIVGLLVAKGARLGQRTESTGATALHFAAKNGDAVLAQALIEANADVDAVAGNALYSATPLYLAAQGGHNDAALVLLAAGADTELSLSGEYKGVTPLLAAVERRNPALITDLLRSGAKARAKKASDGTGAIHIAASHGHISTIRVLLADAIAKVRALVEKKGLSEEKMREALSKRVDARGRGGATPLMTAVKNGHKEATKLLLEVGADCLLLDDSGQSARDIAATARDFDTIGLLQDCSHE